MTDPNLPRDDEPRVVHNTTINNPPERGGGGGAMAFIIGALVIVGLVIAFFVFSNREVETPEPKGVDVDLDINLPEAPKMPDLPEPKLPSVPEPAPAG